MANRFWTWAGQGSLLVALVLPYLVTAGNAAGPQQKCFRLLDATAYADKPDLQARGFEPVQVFEPDRWWPASERHDDLPNAFAAKHWLGDIKDRQGMLILDLERWWVGGSNTAAATQAVRRFSTVIDWLRAEGFTGQIGYYGVIPIWDRGRALQPEGSAARLAWHNENQRARPLADRVDILYPSLYTADEDIQSWERFAVATLEEARQLASGKPVYPFLWPQFAPGDKALALRYIPRAQWARELEVISRNADGAAIWGGIGRPTDKGPPKWDESAAWWQETLALLSRRGACTTRTPESPQNLTIRHPSP